MARGTRGETLPIQAMLLWTYRVAVESLSSPNLALVLLIYTYYIRYLEYMRHY